MKSQHPEFAFRCNQENCVEIFATADLLEKHGQWVHTKIPCSICDKVIRSKHMRHHVQQVHGEKIDQRVVCDLCGKVSGSIAMHNYHVRAEHEVHGRLQCDICKEW